MSREGRGENEAYSVEGNVGVYALADGVQLEEENREENPSDDQERSVHFVSALRIQRSPYQTYPKTAKRYGGSLANFFTAGPSPPVFFGGNLVLINRIAMTTSPRLSPALARTPFSKPMDLKRLLSMIGWMTPPMDAPETTKPITRTRFFWKWWAITPIVGRYIMPIPRPIPRP
jgi:hypothetical protein